jgi:hypothetical protein
MNQESLQNIKQSSVESWITVSVRLLDVCQRRLDRYRTICTDYLVQWKGQTLEQAEWVKERDAVGAEEKTKEIMERRASSLTF